MGAQKKNNNKLCSGPVLHCAHFQCVNNHYEKFENKGMETVGVTDYTQITKFKNPKGGVDAIMSKLNTLKNIIKYYQMCTKEELHIFNV